MDYPGNLFVVAAPSGAGKSSLVKSLLELDSHLVVSISHTTRQPRGQEQEGREYYFIDDTVFRDKISRGEFLEHAEVHGNRYGTARQVILDAVKRGEHLILEIDWQGAQQVRKHYPDCVGIFILPPSVEELERRMRARGQDADEVIRRRVANAHEEISHAGEFQYAIINKDFGTAKKELAEIIQKERAKPHGTHHR